MDTSNYLLVPLNLWYGLDGNSQRMVIVGISVKILLQNLSLTFWKFNGNSRIYGSQDLGNSVNVRDSAFSQESSEMLRSHVTGESPPLFSWISSGNGHAKSSLESHMEYVVPDPGMLSNTDCDSLNSIRNGILEVDTPPRHGSRYSKVMHVFLQPCR